MATYLARVCDFCGASFQPRSSRNKHCGHECRFRSIAAQFEGESGCWEWPLSRQPSGYGQMTLTPRPAQEVITAHRMSYQVFKGAIAPGLCVMHRCDNRACFNPQHLDVGTLADNNRDMTRKGRHWHSTTGAAVLAKAWATRRGQTTSRNRTPAA